VLKKYFLVTTIVVVMVVSMVGMAFAFTDVESDAKCASDFDLLEEIGVYRGYPDGTAKPANEITRAEFAAVVVRMLDKEGTAEAVETQETNFLDDKQIPEWARGYIIVATSLEIINGYPDGTFRASNNVTFAEAIAMLARALGLDDAATGSWPGDYLLLGAEIGLTDAVSPEANEAITRAEMAIMTVNALVSEYEYTSENGLTQTGDSLLAQHWPGVAEAYVPSDASGVYEDYLPASQRIEVSGHYYELALDGTDLYADIIINGLEVFSKGDAAPSVGIAELEEGDEVKLTLNDDNQVTTIKVTRNTYDNTLLTAVDTDSGEVDFGDISLIDSGGGTDMLAVDDDTTILLDDEKVTLAALEAAFEDFEERYDTAAIVTARTEGDLAVSGSRAIWISVITKNTVFGDVTGVGNDGTPFVRIDGDKVYYDEDYLTVGSDFSIGDKVRLLLNHDDVAMLVLVSQAQEARYFGKVTEFALDEDGLDLVGAVKADGTEVTLRSFVGTLTDDPTTDLNKVYEIVIDEHGQADFYARANMTLQSSGLYGDHASTWIEVGGTKCVLADDVFVYDADAGAFITMDDIEDTDMTYVYSLEGMVGFVVIDN